MDEKRRINPQNPARTIFGRKQKNRLPLSDTAGRGSNEKAAEAAPKTTPVKSESELA